MSDQVIEAPKAEAPAQIHIERIRKWGACGTGREWFREKFPQGGSYEDVMDALRADGRNDDANWLADALFNDLTGDLSEAAQSIVRDETRQGARLIAEISSISGDASSGDYAKNASSGDYAKNASSGDYATNASSGYGATNASSGDYAKNASSGYGAENASSGKNSVIAAAGNNSLAKGADGTWIALAEYDADGLCIGFATGCIGVDGLAPDTWYRARGGNLVEA